MVNLDARIFVAGSTGLVGSAIVRRLRRDGYLNLILATRQQADLTDRESVRRLFETHRPEYVFLAAARVGGIAANIASPVEFLLDNLAIQNNVLTASADTGVTRVMFLGSSCIYPRDAPQPMREECFMHGPVEPTNASYAIAKIAGIRLAEALHEQRGLSVVCPMPSNVYGPNDHFDLHRAHVVAALVRRFSEAGDEGRSSVVLWGTGTARREFLHVDDLADACLFLMEHRSTPEIINVGSGVDHTIHDLASCVAQAVGYDGRIEWDTTKPDGMPRKVLDLTRLHALGWRHHIALPEGLESVVRDFHARQAGKEAHAG